MLELPRNVGGRPEQEALPSGCRDVGELAVPDNLLLYVLVGFVAQLIDGALGMAYGVSSTTFLLSTGVGPAMASASVHMAEVFTTLVSGISHLRFGNVDQSLFRRLVIPGVLGGVLGAYVLSELPGDKIKPYVAIYLLLMGVRILWKAIRQQSKSARRVKHVFPLGLVGGFFDAIGGGGMGTDRDVHPGCQRA